MATRFFAYRFGGVRQVPGPHSGLSYTFVGPTPEGNLVPIKVENERDAEIFLLMGTADAGNYQYREVDSFGNPIGPFPPVNPNQRESMIDPKRFPSDDLGISAAEWREVTEDLADPTLYYHKTRIKLFPGRRGS
jgi:hypothetical protein